MPIGIVSVGGFTPSQVVGNDQVARWAGVDPEWIEARTGISERRYADHRTATSDMAVRAAEPLLADAAVAQTVGALVMATATPDQPQPATASVVQQRLGLDGIPAFDLNAVCSGFLFGLSVAEALMATRVSSPHALVVAADKYSTIMDRSDRRTVSLFGDGAGAVLLGRVPQGYGIQGSAMLTDGTAADLVRVEGGGTRRPLTENGLDSGDQLFRMEGRAVRDWGLQFVPKAVHQALEQAGMSVGDIDRVVLHQGNTRLVHSLADAIGVDRSRLAMSAPLFGNTAAASIPLTLAQEHQRRPLQRGERLLLAAVGGGMTAAATVLTWY
ncbi:3-oxoacyl-ACP synthase III family protein [Streptomyces resistomycificus]|uniref:3-oxoacyl-ACP synthase n=1 Tax=Streptomyces resistomycificus TaxID=67356 RepID=A0A0L8LGJ6_9ACTN|nr:ketoacyl-ACP synthase III [Streptomyces resistomycificus]KOG37252.1 3-oxoacyl-ACP synthase [Streptomyces resistomycificus]KUN95211.1 3-oxoacyl-ACP synthase [Streptomyces resistomycificus]